MPPSKWVTRIYGAPASPPPLPPHWNKYNSCLHQEQEMRAFQTELLNNGVTTHLKIRFPRNDLSAI